VASSPSPRPSWPRRASGPALIVAVVIFIVAGVLGLLGKNQIQRATPPVPESTVESIKRDVATVSERIKR
jgi:hypothetical protein